MFLTMQEQESLVSRKLATKKVNEETGMVTYKYARKVFYDNLWEHENAWEVRGHTYHAGSGDLVLAAPRKSFNYGEDGWWLKADLNQKVIVYYKRNGYMLTASKYKGDIIVGTTGTTTSQHAKWGIAEVAKLGADDFFEEGTTHLFEMVHPEDPHIVSERNGIHLLGHRDNKTGQYTPSFVQYAGRMTLQEALDLRHEGLGEGFMVYSDDDEFKNSPCKLKTPHYIGKKLLMRINQKRWVDVLNDDRHIKNTLDKRWHSTLDYLIKTYASNWASIEEQQRRKIIEHFGAFV